MFQDIQDAVGLFDANVQQQQDSVKWFAIFTNTGLLWRVKALYEIGQVLYFSITQERRLCQLQLEDEIRIVENVHRVRIIACVDG